MFGNMMDNMKSAKESLQKELSGQRIQVADSEKSVEVIVSGTRQIVDIKILKEDIDKEQLEDLLIVLINEALGKAALLEAELTERSLKEMLPPGLDSLNNLFNK